MSGVLLRYDGVALGSNESFAVANISNKEEFSKENDLLRRGAVYDNFGNPCDLFSVGLDGSVVALPKNPEYQAVGVWSETQTNENGAFLKPIKMTLVADEYFSTAGVTLVFDTNKGIYANDLLIEWYRDDAKLIEKSFSPDNAEFFCANRVDLFNRVDITFYGLNAPHNRLRLQGVEFGIATEFTASVLKNTQIKQSFSPISEILPINTLNFSIVSREGIQYVFQQRQKIEAYFNDKLKGVFFIKTASQSGEKAYAVSCEDYIGFLEDATFNGGVYDQYNAAYLIRDICGKAGVPVVLPTGLDLSYNITGYLPRGSCRSALQQVLFALQLHADTSNASALFIRSLKGTEQTIPRERIMQGISIKKTDKVTAVEVVAHSYTPTDEEVLLYDAAESGSGDNIEVIFSEPIHSLSLSNGHFVEWSANHAVINASATSILKGKKYLQSKFTKKRENTLISGADKKNILRIENATLVNARNIDILLDSCYNYFVNNQSISAKIVEGKHEGEEGYIYDTPIALGDKLTLKTAFSGDVMGYLESQSFTMNGGILVKDTVLR